MTEETNNGSSQRYLEMLVSNLELPLRARRIFQRLEVVNLGQLIELTESSLLEQRNFGKTSLNEIKTQLSQYGLRLREASTADYKIKKARKLGWRARHTIEKIRELEERGLTKRDIAESVGKSYSYVCMLTSENDLGVKNVKRGIKIRPEIDRMIVDGNSIGDMAEETGQCRQSMLNYINARKAHGYWRRQIKKRIGKEKKEEIIENKRNELVAGAVYGVLENAARNENDFAVRKANEYRIRSPKTKYTVEQLEEVFRVYKEANERGEKLSLKEIGKSSNTGIIYAASIGDILKVVGLEPMHGTNERRSPLSEQELKAIARVKDVGMNALDLSYFMDLNKWNVSQNFQKNDVKRPKVKKWIKHFESPERRSTLSYRVASQIYKARDAGYFREFSRDQMSEFFDTSREAVDYALEHENKIAPKITNVLKKIYSDRRSKKPYRMKSDVL